MAHSPMTDDDHGPTIVTLHLNVTGVTDVEAVEIARLIAAEVQEKYPAPATNERHWWITPSEDWAEHYIIPGREAEYTVVADHRVNEVPPPHTSQPDGPFDAEAC